ncbi:sulfotransferase [Methylobacterium sp. 37f]|uniref:sulfotransferase family protein n=1 Tax=Methylobacterium sp. 37f TaxID=2817058 RepID=UPI001FFCF3A9|nr:sulfotransferase [Methylobacterium sp. 37f]MCK2055485.1 sulfotransferase [Methylobacterium sp. 37f]
MTEQPLTDLVFVGGAPRSGTTILHAVICTSPNTNDYIAECSYITGMLLPYFRGLESWDIHTKHYFENHDKFLSFHSGIMSNIISMIHNQLDRPARLTLKDPIMTRFFHHVAQMLPQARFVVIYRDPRDAILSRLNVSRRLQSGSEPSKAEIESACLEYNISYSGIIAHPHILNHRMIVLNYNDFVSGKELSKLESFGIFGMEPAKVWSSGRTQISEYRADPWSTDLYGVALSPRSINRHQCELDSQVADFIMEQCGWVGKAFGY